MRSRTPVIALALVAALAALVLVIWPRGDKPAQSSAAALEHPERPRTPPVPGRDQPRRPPEPRPPDNTKEILAAAYAQAVAAGAERPGEKAFRATVDAFMTYNRAFAQAQAAQEGLTVAEVHALTYFGFLVRQTQQWTEVEDLLGRPLTAEQRELGEQLMHDSNAEFKATMRKLVAEGAPESARWQLISDTQARYLAEYRALSGMTDELLDDLLAGDALRKYAPGMSSPPPLEDITPAPPPPPVPTRPDNRAGN